MNADELRIAWAQWLRQPGARPLDLDSLGAELAAAGCYFIRDTTAGRAGVYPTPDGWVVQVAEWSGRPAELRGMAAGATRPESLSHVSLDELAFLYDEIVGCMERHPNIIEHLNTQRKEMS